MTIVVNLPLLTSQCNLDPIHVIIATCQNIQKHLTMSVYYMCVKDENIYGRHIEICLYQKRMDTIYVHVNDIDASDQFCIYIQIN